MARKPASKPSPRSKPAPKTARGKSPPARKAPPQKTQQPTRPPFRPWSDLSPERKLDVVGWVIAAFGLLIAIGMLYSNPESFIGRWLGLLNKGFGWGRFILPVAMIGLGIWLVFRNVERLPQLSTARLTGILLWFLNALALLHFLTGSGMDGASQGIGGGYLGAIFDTALLAGFGIAGEVILLLIWLLVALGLTFNRSLHDLNTAFEPVIKRFSSNLRGSLPKVWGWVRRLGLLPFAEEPVKDSSTELPPGFLPLPTGRSSTSFNIFNRENAPSPDQPAQIEASSDKVEALIEEPPPPPAPPLPPWELPLIDEILDPVSPVIAINNMEQEHQKIIEETLAQLEAPGHVVEILRGPNVTLYGVEPDFIDGRGGKIRVRVNKISGLAKDLALALSATSIRIQAPVPGRSYIGIEVPNPEVTQVSLRELIESESFQEIDSPVRIPVGMNVSGQPVAADLKSMPHLLVAGTTGSGKSVLLNAILTCFLLHNTPDDLRLLLVDPKRVELTGYKRIPHLLSPVITDAESVVGALQWIIREMENRYNKFTRAGARDILSYNERRPEEKIPHIIIVVDELGDIMMQFADKTEQAITRLARLSRATGIHLILATQRPSVDIITGSIKANIPARIAFTVASGTDSRVILDQPGAEDLIGRGDMLYLPPDAPAPVRLQGPFVSDSEIDRLVKFWRYQDLERSKTAESPTRAVTARQPKASASYTQPELWREGEEPLLREAVELVRRQGRASTTMLQRKLGIGYNRASRLIDTLEELKIIGPKISGAQHREVLDYGSTAPPPED